MPKPSNDQLDKMLIDFVELLKKYGIEYEDGKVLIFFAWNNGEVTVYTKECPACLAERVYQWAHLPDVKHESGNPAAFVIPGPVH
jgi:hypothetical protein